MFYKDKQRSQDIRAQVQNDLRAVLNPDRVVPRAPFAIYVRAMFTMI